VTIPEITPLDASRFTAEVPCAPGVDVPDRAVVLALHRFIQGDLVDDLLVDVVDYAHVQGGPGVMLIAHEAHYAFGRASGRLALSWARKRGGAPTVEARAREAVTKVLAAARRLADDEGLAGALRFVEDELVVGVDDRLRAPNDDATLATLAPVLRAALAEAWGVGADRVLLERIGGEREAFRARARRA
jgi:hypothetical protein